MNKHAELIKRLNDAAQRLQNGPIEAVLKDAADALQAESAAVPEGWSELASLMLNQGHRYWKAAVKERGPGAVQWLKGDDGAMFVFTRGEYADRIEAFLKTLEPSHGKKVTIVKPSMKMTNARTTI